MSHAGRDGGRAKNISRPHLSLGSYARNNDALSSPLAALGNKPPRHDESLGAHCVPNGVWQDDVTGTKRREFLRDSIMDQVNPSRCDFHNVKLCDKFRIEFDFIDLIINRSEENGVLLLGLLKKGLFEGFDIKF